MGEEAKAPETDTRQPETPVFVMPPVEQTTQQVDTIAEEIKSLRWGLIQKRFRAVDMEAQIEGWEKKPPTGGPVFQRYLEWVYMRDHWAEIRAGKHPRGIHKVQEGGTMAAEAPPAPSDYRPDWIEQKAAE